MRKKRLLSFFMVLLILTGMLWADTALVFADAADTVADWEEEANKVETSREIDVLSGNFTMDTEEVGITKSLNVMGNVFAGLWFGITKGITALTVKICEGATQMEFVGDMADFLQEHFSSKFTKLLVFDGTNQIMIIGIFVVLASALFAFTRMQVSKGIGNIMKFLCIFVLAFLLTTNSAAIFTAANGTINGFTNDITKTLTGNDNAEAAIWKLGVTLPWQMLTFGDIEHAQKTNWNTSTSLDTTVNKDKTDTATGSKTLKKQVGATLATRYSDEYGDTLTVDNAKAKLKDAMSGIKKGSIAEAYLLDDPDGDTRDLISKSAKANGISWFKPVSAIQMEKGSYAFMYMLLVLLIAVMMIALAIGVLIVKILALLLFFLGVPFAIIALLSPQGMEVIKRWIMILGICFFGMFLVQMIMILVLSILSALVSTIKSPSGLLFCMFVVLALALAIRFGARPIMSIISPQATRRVSSEIRQWAMLRHLREQASHRRGSGNSNSRDNNNSTGDNEGAVMNNNTEKPATNTEAPVRTERTSDTGTEVNAPVDEGGRELGQVHNGEDDAPKPESGESAETMKPVGDKEPDGAEVKKPSTGEADKPDNPPESPEGKTPDKGAKGDEVKKPSAVTDEPKKPEKEGKGETVKKPEKEETPKKGDEVKKPDKEETKKSDKASAKKGDEVKKPEKAAPNKGENVRKPDKAKSEAPKKADGIKKTEVVKGGVPGGKTVNNKGRTVNKSVDKTINKTVNKTVNKSKPAKNSAVPASKKNKTVNPRPPQSKSRKR